MLRSWQPNEKFRKFLSSHPHPRESKIRIALDVRVGKSYQIKEIKCHRKIQA